MQTPAEHSAPAVPKQDGGVALWQSASAVQLGLATGMQTLLVQASALEAQSASTSHTARQLPPKQVKPPWQSELLSQVALWHALSDPHV
jgi:hypothetical protein